MNVTRLAFENFRNLQDGSITPCDSINVIYGSNAQGKTNLLEAIWLFTGGHSFRGTKDAELPRLTDGKNADAAALSMELFTEGRAQELMLFFKNGRRTSRINGVEKKTGSALVGKFCAVIFSPEHLLLVKEGPARRRAFMDGALCQAKPAYARVLANYNKALLQRNALLKDMLRHPELEDTLDVWDERLVLFGTQVVLERIAFCNLLAPKAAEIYAGIAREKEAVSFTCAVRRCENDGGHRGRFCRRAQKCAQHRYPHRVYLGGAAPRRFEHRDQRAFRTHLRVAGAAAQHRAGVKARGGRYPL